MSEGNTTPDEKIAHLEMQGRIAGAWNGIGSGLDKLEKVLDDLLEPPQQELFALEPADFSPEIKLVVQEATRRLTLLGRRLGIDG